MEFTRKQTQSYKDKVVKLLESAPDIHRDWSEFEDSMIRQYYRTKGAVPLSKALNRTQNSINKRANSLGIYCKRGEERV